MAALNAIVDLVLHLDVHLGALIQAYGGLTYGLMFLIIFAETGLVVTPFLPGDSMIFAAATFAGVGALDINILWIGFFLAAVLGDTVNYWVGRYIGPRVFKYENHPIFKKKYLDETSGFFEHHGGKTIILARFIPIIRTFAPFIAGVGQMKYRRFFAYNVVGGAAWVGFFVFSGYFFGNLPWVRENFSLVILAILLFSFAPAIYEFLKGRLVKKAKTPEIHGNPTDFVNRP